MTSPGRQYPDGPLEPPPGWPNPLGAMKSFGAAMDRLYTDPGVPAAEASALGQMMHAILGAPDPEPGPPYVHVLVPPEPIGEDKDGNDIYPEPGPAYTVREIPLAELVDPDRPAWLVRAAVACDARERRREFLRIAIEERPLSIAVGEPIDWDEYRWKPGAGEP